MIIMEWVMKACVMLLWLVVVLVYWFPFCCALILFRNAQKAIIIIAILVKLITKIYEDISEHQGFFISSC